MWVVGHGVDLVEVVRIAELLDAHGDRFLERCFTVGERRYAEHGRRRRVERYAVRFAAKEAVFKALGTGWRHGISWRDVEVLREPTGRPGLALRGRCAEIAAGLGIAHWQLSLSHTARYALASAIGGQPLDGTMPSSRSSPSAPT